MLDTAVVRHRDVAPPQRLLDELLREMAEQGASDLHIATGYPPVMRIDGTLKCLDDRRVLDAQATHDIIHAILNPVQIERLETNKNLDLSYCLDGGRRFRGNVLWQCGTIGAVFRAIAPHPPALDTLGLPRVLEDLAVRPRGLVLVTGPSGSGKSTTLAAMVDFINRRQRRHIVTIEDPIEFVHECYYSIVRQREIGVDVDSFTDALRYVLRQDPDVIVVGEMRDLETIGLAMSAAETGHLVLATLHTLSAQTTVERIVDVFPATQQPQIRVQLASILEGVICQTLLPHISGTGRVVAAEVMLAMAAVRTLIREGQHHRLESVVETGARFGMNTLNQALRDLVLSKQISYEVASACSPDPVGLDVMTARTPR